MVAAHIHDAIAQVRRLQSLILARKNFQGYSGTARLCGALLALGAAQTLSSPAFGTDPRRHLAGWCTVLALALLANYGALAGWAATSPAVRLNPMALLPILDALPPLAVGATLSAAAVLRGQYDLLFGTWMSLYGLAHMVYRTTLPRANLAVGAFYLGCGASCLLWPGVSFVNPWPMGTVFAVGETAGAWVFFANRRECREEEP